MASLASFAGKTSLMSQSSSNLLKKSSWLSVRGSGLPPPENFSTVAMPSVASG
eukprot:CAMPEP_0118859136 /NCGR_PEP_ID=MMETSP1163-20130328/5515_1 /TAXON_ID=124430 /ORGANISM="Phaeomonas parva, Strain CCMP2877" /LENGTH=52 /DNA_ID=CAMNT_0006792683 /DNA_START=157 /DNA_END=315 /DNA_ORIENTATION=-